MAVPSLPTYPQTEADFMVGLNSDSYDADTNPKGFADGGHIPLFPETTAALAVLATYFHDLGDVLQAIAEQVETDAASAAAGSGTEATAAAIRSGVNANYMSVRRLYAANVPVVLADAATIAWDMSTGIDFEVTLGAAGRAMANPTNKVAGKNGVLRVKQDATGGRTITSWGTDFIWIGGEPTWPAAANARSLIAYIVGADGKVELSFAGSSA